MNETVTGKAAWDALGGGKALRRIRPKCVFQIQDGLLWAHRENRSPLITWVADCSQAGVDYTRIGDAPPWGDE